MYPDLPQMSSLHVYRCSTSYSPFSSADNAGSTSSGTSSSRIGSCGTSSRNSSDIASSPPSSRTPTSDRSSDSSTFRRNDPSEFSTSPDFDQYCKQTLAAQGCPAINLVKEEQAILATVSAFRDIVVDGDEVNNKNDGPPMTFDEVMVHWEDNRAKMEIDQAYLDTWAKMEKRMRESDEKEERRRKRRARKAGLKAGAKQLREGPREKDLYDFMTGVQSTPRFAGMDTVGGAQIDNPSLQVFGDETTESVPDQVKQMELVIPCPAVQVKEEIPDIFEADFEILPLLAQENRCEIRPISKKGLGVVATTSISQGQAIITEIPFLIVDHPPNAQQVQSRLSRLPDHLQKLFHTFNPAHAAHHRNRLVDIVATNVIPLGDQPYIDLTRDDDDDVDDDYIIPLDANLEIEEKCQAGLFKTICRVNHSCSPNSRWTWFTESSTMVLRALRPIRKNEEITACYLQDTALGHDDRQTALQATWQFTCTCSICSLPAHGAGRSASDRRRAHFREIRDQYIGEDNVDTWKNEGLTSCSAKIKKAIKLLEEDDQEGEIAECRWSLFLLSIRWGDEFKAKREGSAWLRQVKKMGDVPGDQNKRIIKNPRHSVYWGMYDDDRSGDESEADSGDDFESYRDFKRLRLQASTSAERSTNLPNKVRRAVTTAVKKW